MGVSASGLRDETIVLFPGDWKWLSGQANYAYIDALCQGFASMWAAGVMAPGLGGPPPPPAYPHTHVLTTLVAALMSAPVAGLGYAGAATQFATDIAGSVSSYLISSTVMDVQDGIAPHAHGLTFGSGSGLKSAIIGAVSMNGPAIDPFVDAFATALMDHLTANAATATGFGPAHVHVLS